MSLYIVISSFSYLIIYLTVEYQVLARRVYLSLEVLREDEVNLCTAGRSGKLPMDTEERDRHSTVVLFYNARDGREIVFQIPIVYDAHVRSANSVVDTVLSVQFHYCWSRTISHRTRIRCS